LRQYRRSAQKYRKAIDRAHGQPQLGDAKQAVDRGHLECGNQSCIAHAHMQPIGARSLGGLKG
jgi:hypothetical protein